MAGYDNQLSLTTMNYNDDGFRLIYENMREGVCLHELIYDEDGVATDYRIIDANPAFESITGIYRKDAINETGSKLYQTGSPPFLNVYARVADCGESESFEVFWPPMEKYFLISVCSPRKGQFATIFTDITEKHKAEKAVFESNERFQKIFNSQLDAIFVLTAESRARIVECNKAAEIIFGYEPHEMIGRSVDMFLRDKSMFQIHKQHLFEAYEIKGHLKNYPLSLLRKDGSLFPVDGTMVELTNENGKRIGWLAIIKDLTDQKEIERRLRQAQKMEAIGNLAAGIAHDFNNILFPIVGMSELLLEDLPKGSLVFENAGEILKAGKRGSELVNQILAFSRQTDHQMVPIKIQKVVRDVLKLIRSTIPSDIAIKQDIENDCRPVMADPTQIHQTLMNLATNAYHAVEQNRGEIHISLKEVEITGTESEHFDLTPGKYALLTVSDTGCGIDPAVMDKIFEPYFTTKEQGKGTGLGLAVVYGIIREHKGDIKVFSKPGSGTTVDIVLPLIKRYRETSEDLGAALDKSGNERILLVDDEEAIVEMVNQMLLRAGYQVTTFTRSMDALEYFSSAPDTFDLVITDMTMPNMTGDRLADRMLSIRHDLPIIVCTGFSERIDKESAYKMGIKGFIMKPIIRSEILQLIRSVLDEA